MVTPIGSLTETGPMNLSRVGRVGGEDDLLNWLVFVGTPAGSIKLHGFSQGALLALECAGCSRIALSSMRR